jgi:uncharacterized protein
MKDIEKEIQIFQSYFVKIWDGAKPLARLFRTASRGYLYDTGSNKIIGCNEMVFSLLEKFLSMEIEQAICEFVLENGREQFLFAANTVKNAIEKENVLLAKKAEQFDLSEHYHNYEELIESSLEILFLEVTELCNLCCGYCVYNDHVKYKRDHGKRNMELSAAYRAIDYLNKHSFRRNKVAICYYGGEPTIRFPLIKSCVKYSRSIIKNREIEFSITTNATLVTPEIAEFFYKNDFSVFASIDGPEEINNSYRKDSNGDGSYKNSIRGLKNLIDAYGGTSKNKISLSMVYTPPFSSKRIDRIAELWDEIPWLPKNIGIQITYPNTGSIPVNSISKNEIEEDRDLRQWAFERFRDKYIGKGDSHPIADSIMKRNLAQLIQRPLFHENFDRYYLNGCCLPGVKRLYVSAGGNFHVCEKIASEAPTIGDIYSGIDIDVIKEVYIDGYEKISLPLCSTCWAVRLCSSCYTDVFKKGELDLETKSNNCIHIKKTQERLLEYYCLLMEKNPEGLNFLYDFELT